MFTLFLSFPEIDTTTACNVLVKKKNIPRVMCRRFVEGIEEETSRICSILLSMYRNFIQARPVIRNEIVMVLEELIEITNSSASKDRRKMARTLALCTETLLQEVVLPVITGFRSSEFRKSHESLLDLLLRLHLADTMVNEITPTLQLYHESLVRALLAFLSVFSSDKRIHSRVVRFVIRCYPTSRAANTPKSVLILHELEQLTELCSDSVCFNREIRDVLTPVLLRGISSDNSRIAQRSLQFFRNDVVRHLYMEREDAVRDLLVCLLRKGQKHWNQTVNRMSCAVLRYVRDDWKDSYGDVVSLKSLNNY